MTVARANKRSDILRERRRKNRRINKNSNISKRRSNIRTKAPTVVRSRSMAVQPRSNKKYPQARQRNYLSLGTTGAEIRLPAIPRFHVGWRLVSGPMVALIIFAIYTFFNSPFMQVDVVEVVGLERISSAEINAILGVYGSAIFSISPNMLEKNLRAALPELTEVDISVTFPASITVIAGERRPVILWDQEDFSAWVDLNGVAFRERAYVEGLVRVVASNPPTLPETIDPIQDQIITSQMVQAILTLSLYAPAGTDILYDPEHGLGWQDPQGWQVFFGHSPDDIDSRLAIYAEIVKEINKKGIRPVLISLEYLHAPYYRLVAAE